MKNLSVSQRFNFALSCKSVFFAASSDDFGDALVNNLKLSLVKSDVELNGVPRTPDTRYKRKDDDDDY